MILDNVLAAFETIHYLKRLGKVGGGKLVLKLDMAKACDRVEWFFLDRMMHTMDFPARFVNFIMGCITIASYLVLLQADLLLSLSCPRVCAKGIQFHLTYFLSWLRDSLPFSTKLSSILRSGESQLLLWHLL
ncbi:hypothetical protein ACE6H2_006180 [Prunus campanulata]